MTASKKQMILSPHKPHGCGEENALYGYAEIAFVRRALPLLVNANLPGRDIVCEYLNMDQEWVTFSDRYAPRGYHWAEPVLNRLQIPFDAFTACSHSNNQREWRSGRWTRQGWRLFRTSGGSGPLMFAPAHHESRCGLLRDNSFMAVTENQMPQPIDESNYGRELSGNGNGQSQIHGFLADL